MLSTNTVVGIMLKISLPYQVTLKCGIIFKALHGEIINLLEV